MTLTINPAELDRRISIIRSVDRLDEAGKPLSTGEEVLLVAWAKYIPISDSEKLTHKHQADLSARFTIRWSNAGAGAKSSDRLIFDGKTFGIFGIKEIGRRQYLEITGGAHEA